MATKLPATDVVMIGLGWTGAMLANELTEQGLRGRGDRARAVARYRDQLSPRLCTGRTALRDASRTAGAAGADDDDFSQQAPVRRRCRSASWGSFLPGNGVGGAASIGMARPGASCRPILSLGATSPSATARTSCRPT